MPVSTVERERWELNLGIDTRGARVASLVTRLDGRYVYVLVRTARRDLQRNGPRMAKGLAILRPENWRWRGKRRKKKKRKKNSGS